MKIFADGADIESMRHALDTYKVDGFTTNPSLMVKAGVEDYFDFAQRAVSEFNPLPISFEVFADEFDEMYEQAMKLSGLSGNVYVKVPVTNTKGISSCELLRSLSGDGVKVNVTAVFTLEQVKDVYEAIDHNTPSVVSIFAGRIADTLIDPEPIIQHAAQICKATNCEVLWASARELINIYHAYRNGCDIITLSHNILQKLDLKDKDLQEYSLETVKMFFQDALSVGYSL